MYKNVLVRAALHRIGIVKYTGTYLYMHHNDSGMYTAPINDMVQASTSLKEPYHENSQALRGKLTSTPL
jgi:hypothetical protein